MVTFTGIPWPWGNKGFTKVEEAQELLGQDKVYTASQVLKAWNCPTNVNPDVLYPINVIKRCRRENERKKDRMDWRLVYGIGFDLQKMLKIRGTDQRHQPMFCEVNTMWQQPSEEYWTKETFPSGYYLINFRLLFKNYKMSTQDLMVTELGKYFSALPPQILAEVLFSIFMITSERLLEREIHSSPVTDSFGYHVKIGYFDSNGLTLSAHDYQRRDNGVITHLCPHLPDLQKEDASEDTPAE
jgi:hypothetical protein